MNEQVKGRAVTHYKMLLRRGKQRKEAMYDIAALFAVTMRTVYRWLKNR